MIKRTTGRLLLTLLVTTGLAGTIHNSSLSQKERKQAIGMIKSSRNEITKCTSGLSAGQINFKPSSKDPSIGELVMSLATLEKNNSDLIKLAMDQPTNPECRLKIALTDEQLLTSGPAPLLPTASVSFKNPEEALKKFNSLRDHYIKYIRTSTEDFRNHVIQTPAGWIDCYQHFLLLADQSSLVAEKINQLKSSPHFPKK